MKRIVSMVLIFVMVLSLAGCGSGGETIKGVEGAKLLLARERLNAEELYVDSELLTDGAEVFRYLADTARASMASYAAELPVTTAGAEQAPERKGAALNAAIRFPAYSNTNEYFAGLTEEIAASAEQAADLIDMIKKHIRVVDVWVEDEVSAYYLHVGSNEEVVCSVYEDQVNICRRYKNAQGQNVYELLIENDLVATRYTYIPGQHYERTELWKNGSGSQYFVADHTKGYWDTYFLGMLGDHYNASTYILRDGICCNISYNMEASCVDMVAVIGGQGDVDVFRASLGEVALFHISYNGFDGIADLSGDTVTFANGKSVKEGDLLMDGAIQVAASNYAETAYGMEGDLLIYAYAETEAEQLGLLRSFIEEYGLQCRSDLNKALAGVSTAYAVGNQFLNYYRWNGYPINNEASLAPAEAVEEERVNEMRALYTAIRDAERVSMYDVEALSDRIQFAAVTPSFGTASYAEGVAVIDGLTLSISDTTLYVEEEPYVVDFALLAEDGQLIHLPVERNAQTAYDGSKKFSVASGSATVSLTVPKAGTYSLVAYLSTADGIRSSGYTKVAFDTVSADTLQNADLIAAVSQGSEGELVVASEKSKDIYLSMEANTPDYAAFESMLQEVAYTYGSPAEDAVVEMYVSEQDAYQPLTGQENQVHPGSYRLKYLVNDGTDTGYIYLNYGV